MKMGFLERNAAEVEEGPSSVTEELVDVVTKTGGINAGETLFCCEPGLGRLGVMGSMVTSTTNLEVLYKSSVLFKCGHTRVL